MKAYAMVWVNKSAKVKSVALHLGGGGVSTNMDLTPEEALRLAKELTEAVAEIPRTVTADDLGLGVAA